MCWSVATIVKMCHSNLASFVMRIYPHAFDQADMKHNLQQEAYLQT